MYLFICMCDVSMYLRIIFVFFMPVDMPRFILLLTIFLLFLFTVLIVGPTVVGCNQLQVPPLSFTFFFFFIFFLCVVYVEKAYLFFLLSLFRLGFYVISRSVVKILIFVNWSDCSLRNIRHEQLLHFNQPLEFHYLA